VASLFPPEKPAPPTPDSAPPSSLGHGLPDRPRSARGFSSRLVPLAQRYDSLPARDHRTRPGSPCPCLDARYPRWHWRQGCCWCWQRRRSHGSSRRTRDHRTRAGSSCPCLGSAPAARGGVRSTAGAWCSWCHRTHASRPTRERDHRNHAGCLSRRWPGANWSRHREESGCRTCWCSRRRWRPGALLWGGSPIRVSRAAAGPGTVLCCTIEHVRENPSETKPNQNRPGQGVKSVRVSVSCEAAGAGREVRLRVCLSCQPPYLR
jgi:hypothetical protein